MNFVAKSTNLWTKMMNFSFFFIQPSSLPTILDCTSTSAVGGLNAATASSLILSNYFNFFTTNSHEN